MERVFKDERFRHIAKDVRFMDVPRKELKVKVDERFQSMFTDKNFNLQHTVDSRGRPRNFSSTSYFEKFYDVSSSDDDEQNGQRVGDNKQKKGRKAGNKSRDDNDLTENDKQLRSVTRKKKPVLKHNKPSCSSAEKSLMPSSGDDDDDEEEEEMTEDKKTHTMDYLRGIGNIESSSSDESSDSDDSDGVIHPWGEMDKDAQATETSTRRLALCNMDWEVVTAKFILSILSSFLPMGKIINSVKIYLSDFGREQMKLETIGGPVRLFDAEADSKNSNRNKKKTFHPDGEYFNKELVRQYEINRLRYYYAVIDCEDVQTADAIYKNCDSLEIRASSMRLDLRFVPDDMEFDDQPTDVADSSMDLSRYRARMLPSRCLEGSSVKLSWDESKPFRTFAMQRAFEGDDEEQQEQRKDEAYQFLASSSSDDDDDNELERGAEEVKRGGSEAAKADGEANQDEVPKRKELDKIAKYRELLNVIEEKEKEKEENRQCVEVTWDMGLQEKTEALVQEKMKEIKLAQMTPWEQFLARRSENQRQKKEMKRRKNTENSEDDDDDRSDVKVADSNDRLTANDVPTHDTVSSDAVGNCQFRNDVKNNKESNTVKSNTNEQAALKLLVMDEDDDKNHFSLKKLVLTEKEFKRQKYRKINKDREEDYFQMNVSDPRFGAVYTSHLYHIDPSHHHFHKTEAMLSVVDEKLRRIGERDEEPADSQRKAKRQKVEDHVDKLEQSSLSSGKVEMNMLVKSLKNRVASAKLNKRHKK